MKKFIKGQQGYLIMSNRGDDGMFYISRAEVYSSGKKQTKFIDLDDKDMLGRNFETEVLNTIKEDTQVFAHFLVDAEEKEAVELGLKLSKKELDIREQNYLDRYKLEKERNPKYANSMMEISVKASKTTPSVTFYRDWEPSGYDMDRIRIVA